MTDMISEEMVRVKADKALRDLILDLRDDAEEWGRGLPYADIVRIVKESASELSDEEDEE